MESEPGTTGDARPLLLFFQSERSGPARRMESLLAHLARKERERLRVAAVDVDARPDLVERFQISVVPTLVLLMDRRTVERAEGRLSAPKIERLLEPYLLTREPAPSVEMDDPEPVLAPA